MVTAANESPDLMKPTCALTLLALTLACGSACAQGAPVYLPPAAAGTALTVTPDRDDWTYPMGAPASVRVKLALDPYPAAGVTIRYRLGPDMLEGAERTAVVPADGLVLPVPAPSTPAFMRIIASADVGGQNLTTLATLGFAPDKIVPTQANPADVDAFWARQKAALAQVPPDYRLTPAPELSNDRIEVSYLSFRNVGGNGVTSRFYGVLAVPRGAGPFPAVLELPGAGIEARTGARALAEKGAITLQVGIHGIPLNLAPEVYESLAGGALFGYSRINLDDREKYYFRRVNLGVLRAADYLATHPKWNRQQLLAMGGSQGGMLSIMAAALEPRITAVVANNPGFSDVTGYLNGRAGGWPALFKPGPDGAPTDAPVAAKAATTAYYDTVNFARRLRVPGFYFWGYNDVLTPPTSTFAAYNVITAPKQLTVAPAQGHAMSPEQLDMVQQWVLRQLGLAK
ncbi:acetylxylan esterase [Massilia sp. CCM 9210]|uniref:acetylxylan esterase n=1 Tax=Massilia scottii TaxID=3057166 RepID=UPI002796CDBF|nr:acetylxylan esterase [Massilia sp. CCM 9210]MDQ1816039.1 acetylxylan esterase [Massilia sp. CCM 9210]